MDEKTREKEQAYQRAGFRVERNGSSTVFERELPESVIEDTRALINGHGKASRSGTNDTAKTNGGSTKTP
jgi:hypothetical protein